MAKKKDLASAIGAMLPDVQQAQDTIEEYDARKTQGKAGMKLERMNMGFSSENYEFLRVMAVIHKMSITKYVNHLIEEERRRSADLYNKAKDLMNNL